MIDRLCKERCTGCGACVNFCPQSCIAMREDAEGFAYPVIDRERCSGCNLCEVVCPALSGPVENRNFPPQVKAAWSLHEEVRWQSTSGGIFTELAAECIRQGGAVAGARYTETHAVEHCLIQSADEIALLRQSKYVQSRKGWIYRQVKQRLDAEQAVLFVGAPCEVSALLKYLQKPYGHLLTCDFICLGANSPKVYRKFLATLEKRYGAKVKRVWFKNKTYGWNRFSTKVEFENGTFYLRDRYHDFFMRGYIGERHLYMRPCCAQCQYRSIPRVADITLADFWGVADKNPRLDADKGTSLVLLNSARGAEWFERIQSSIFAADCALEDAVPGNRALFCSVQMDAARADFFRDLERMDFDTLIDAYCRRSLLQKLRERIKRKMRAVFSGKVR